VRYDAPAQSPRESKCSFGRKSSPTYQQSQRQPSPAYQQPQPNPRQNGGRGNTGGSHNPQEKCGHPQEQPCSNNTPHQ